jgi:hypothetical protein
VTLYNSREKLINYLIISRSSRAILDQLPFGSFQFHYKSIAWPQLDLPYFIAYGFPCYHVLRASATITLSMSRPKINRDDIHRALINSVRPALTFGAGSGEPYFLRDVGHEGC